MKFPTPLRIFVVTSFLAVTPSWGKPLPVPSTIQPERLSGAKPRNVVFILSDDHRWDAMSFMNHPLAETPQMDRLAAEGAHLRNALVTTSLCSPSRASILTGLYTFRHRVIDNQRPVPEGTVYFPQYLQKAGYATAFIGKWHMGSSGDRPQPGFDRWVSFRGQGQYLPTGNTLNVDGADVPQQGYITDELTDYAVDWLKQQHAAEKPFFLYLSHKAVHANFTPAERHAGQFADRAWQRAPSEAVTAEMTRHQPRWLRDQRNSWHGVDFPYHSELDIDAYYRAYAETLSAVDDSIGRVMAQLETMGVADDTLVVYMGDNGFMFGEHGLIDKRVAYEASIRVPMLMRCPALFAGGQVIDEVVANIDIAPTVMEMMGLQAPAHFDGLSVAPLLRGEHPQWRDYFLYVYYWERNFPQSPTVFALRGDRYKYITYYGLWDQDELYDLQDDPDEMHNLIQHPDQQTRVATMADTMFAMMDELGGMQIPLNAPRGRTNNLRYRSRGGEAAADFPESMVVDQPVNANAH
ncbi:sulfatase family protein [Synoicihabitans lomoniglobus]|uniref:Sulfatase n=1 Tax=Synoicihabitans lomoniglobus TaxID=2909285 RepID=A0AAF0CP84_9BACT|nr:sulfatase [Opitutaceae bacterium LMO-M01]WED63559.1 sulfatase [Opitutaceae bacterium LMO-M01]